MKKLAAIAFVLGTGMISARSAYAIGQCSQVCSSGTEPCSLFCYVSDPHTVIDCGQYTNHKHCVPGLSDDDASCGLGALGLTLLHDDANIDLGALGAALVDDVWSAVHALPVV